jgi:hypothetical protein
MSDPLNRLFFFIYIYIYPVIDEQRTTWFQKQGHVEGSFPVDRILSAFSLTLLSAFRFLSSAVNLDAAATLLILDMSSLYSSSAFARFFSESLCRYVGYKKKILCFVSEKEHVRLCDDEPHLLAAFGAWPWPSSRPPIRLWCP